MQEYGRCIAYFHMYECGQQAQNTGFVKAEVRGDICRLGIRLREDCRPGGQPGKAYIYFYHRERMIGLCLGELMRDGGALMWQGILDPGNIRGTGIRFQDTKGIWVPGTRDLVAQWEEGPVDVSRFMVYPERGEKCIRCPKFGSCERSSGDASDRRRKIYDRGHPAGT